MITFGYRNPWSGLVRAFASLGLGILAVAYPGDVLPLLVEIFAIVLGLYGVGMLVYSFVNRKERHFGMYLSNALIEIAVAVLVFMFSGYIANIAVKLIGFLLVLAGIYQVIVLFSACRVIRFGFWFFLLPVVEVGLGLVLMFASQLFTETVAIIVGVALVVSGLSELISSVKIMMIQRKVKKALQPEDQKANVADAEEQNAEVK